MTIAGPVFCRYLWFVKLKIRHRAANTMMLLSLVLLAAFLLWFLRSVWNDEVEALNREGNLLLVKSVREIEGETLNRFLFKKIDRLPGDTGKLSWDMHLPIPHDSISTVTILGEDDDTFIRKVEGDTSKMKTRQLKTDVKIIRKNDQTTGALSVILSMKKEESGDDINFHTVQDTGLVFQRLTNVFSKVIHEAALPVTYTIERSHFDSVPDNTGRITYFDVASSERYDIVLAGYTGYVLKRMTPQILFALLLFSMISLAFFLIRQNLKRQQQLTEIKNDFIRNITHELKTPVATVSVAIEAMQHFGALENPERAREYLSISGSELNRLSLLIDKVLRMSLFEEGETTIKKESFDFRQLVEEIIATMRLQFEKYQAKVQLKVSDGVFTLNGDRLHLASVVYNLLDNALKYSAEQPSVAIDIHRSNEQIILKVTDNGKGIPAAYVDKIFEKFFRVPTGDVHNIKGHGLGLSYVAGVIRQHQGDIRVESRVGEGTSFEISLPV